MQGPELITDGASDAAGSSTLAQSLDATDSLGEALLTVTTAPEGAAGLLSAASGFLFGPLVALGRSGGAVGAVGGAGVGAVVAAAGVSACVGAGLAKLWSDAVDAVFARRLAEVRKHAAIRAPAGVDLRAAARQLLTSFDWSLSVEEQNPSGVAVGLHCLGLGRFAPPAENSGGVRVAATPLSGKEIRRRLHRQTRRIWHQCREQPSLPRRTRASSNQGPMLSVRRQSAADSVHNKELRAREAYEKLFNPQRGSVTGNHGLCTALCFLVSAYLEHRHGEPNTHLRDAERSSLRMAVAALARHPCFDDIPGAAGNTPNSGDSEQDEFLRGALALLCFLDAALAWRPVDPLGLFGECEDGEGLLVGHQKGSYAYPVLAVHLRRSLKKAAAGCRVLWRRLSVHLDVLRSRELPAPWPWVWVHTHDASMLVRNRTKVPLRVELYSNQVGVATGSPWSDWRFLAWTRKLLGLKDDERERPVLSAKVGPGIEWALRPQVPHGQHFQMRLLTEAGVVVCSKRLRRGQTFDFAVKVPPRRVRADAAAAWPVVVARFGGSAKTEADAAAAVDVARIPMAPAAAALARRAVTGIGTKMAAGPDVLAPGSGDIIESQSVGSTAAPSDALASRRSVSTRGSVTVFSASAAAAHAMPPGRSFWGTAEDEFLEDAQAVAGLTANMLPPPATAPAGENEQAFALGSSARLGGLATSEVIRAAICPRCLRDMPARNTRPAAHIYLEGVRCDHCSTELISGRRAARDAEKFYHCARCWFDLCRACAVREMKQVWWSDDD